MAAGLLVVASSCLLLLITAVSAQLSLDGVCTQWTGTGKCFRVDVMGTCPSGWTPHPQLGQPGMLWACGGWWSTCCIPSATPTTTTTIAPAPPGPIIDDSDCGLGNPLGRILMGQSTSKCDWPFVVSIRAKIPGQTSNLPLTQSNTGHACGGVIISRNWVLTHAVCCYFGLSGTATQASSELVVVAGEYDVNKVDTDPRTGVAPLEQFIPVSQCIRHPNYINAASVGSIPLNDNRLVNGYGYALVKLAKPISNYCSSIACLPSATPLMSRSCDTFTQCVITGWGLNAGFNAFADSSLKQGFVTIYKDDVCNFLSSTLFKSSGVARPDASACQTNSSAQLVNDACYGDQGGPVLCYDGNRWSVQGIIPLNFCYEGKVNPYVIDVKQAETWILNTIRNNP